MRRDIASAFASAVAGGALVALLSHLLAGIDASGSRITVSYMVGFLLALGPFDHVVVTGLHVAAGLRFGAAFGVTQLGEVIALATLGNLVGGLGLVTLSHVGQAVGARQA